MDSKLTGSDHGNIAPRQCLDASLEPQNRGTSGVIRNLNARAGNDV